MAGDVSQTTSTSTVVETGKPAKPIVADILEPFRAPALDYVPLEDLERLSVILGAPLDDTKKKFRRDDSVESQLSDEGKRTVGVLRSPSRCAEPRALSSSPPNGKRRWQPVDPTAIARQVRAIHGLRRTRAEKAVPGESALPGHCLFSALAQLASLVCGVGVRAGPGGVS